MAELDTCLCADAEPHEPHDYPLDDPEWVGPPMWHCPGRTALPELADSTPEWLPGTSASKFRDGLRTTFLIIGFPTFMFGMLGIVGWGYVAFMLGMLIVMLGVDVAHRARRLRAIRGRGELP